MRAGAAGRGSSPIAEEVVTIRPIEPRDVEAYRSVLERTSEEDRYCRFFHAVNHFELSDVRPFVEPCADMIGFIAEDGRTALGAAHAFYVAPPIAAPPSAALASAEIAIVVASDARHLGVGRALLEHLIRVLRARHCTNVTAFSLNGNNAFSHLARSVGMVPIGPPAEMMTWSLTAAST